MVVSNHQTVNSYSDTVIAGNQHISSGQCTYWCVGTDNVCACMRRYTYAHILEKASTTLSYNGRLRAFAPV